MYGCKPQHGTGIACSRFELSMSQVSLRLYSCHTAHGRNRPLRLSSRLSSMLLLVLAGDVEINPGPRRCKYPCGLCNLAVKKTDPAVCCDSCDTWIHNGCSGLSHNMYEVLKNTSCSWICPQCGMPSFSSSFWSSNSFSTSNSFSCLSDIGDDTAINDCGPVLASSPVKQAKRSILKIRGLKIMSVNVNGLRSKKLDICELLDTANPDILLCQETRVDHTVYSSEIFPDGYSVFRRDRDLHGGGVCIVVSNKLQATRCHDLENVLEAVWISVITPDHQPLYVCSMYRPPDKKGDYITDLRQPLEKLYTRHPNRLPFIVIAGDFNYPRINWETVSVSSHCDGQPFLDILNDFHFQQLVDRPTHHTRTVSNILDLVLCTNPTLISNLSIGSEIADHCTLSFYINFHITDTSELDSTRKIFLYNKGNYCQIRSDMKSFCERFLSTNPTERTINKNWKMFTEALWASADKNIPSKQAKPLSKRKPVWLTKPISNLIKKRDKLAKAAAKSGSIVDRNRYKKVRNQVSKAVDESYHGHLNNILGNVKQNPRAFYRYIKARKSDSVGIPPLKSSGGLLTFDNDKVDCLNSHFSSVFTHENLHSLPSLKRAFPLMSDFQITEPGVLKLLNGLDINKSTGPDNISPRLLKETGAVIAPVLTFIFNQSLLTGELPDDWRMADIFPLHKKGPRNLPENYRPISLTCIACKVMEHIVYSSISRFLDTNKILCPRQHGFRAGHSCETQLILAIDDWAKTLDHGAQADVAIFDFSKAFDSVPHQRLLAKLEYYGISGNTLKWLKAFLTCRKQRVVLNNSQSSWQPVVSGVPQGTVLGPLLFLLYINDIDQDIQSTVRLFADDCILYREINNASDAQILQDDINKFQAWASAWQMKFNSSKCHIMSITRKRNKFVAKYNLGESQLSRVDSYPYLGVVISSDLRWRYHIDSVCAKATRTLNFVKRNCYRCSIEAKTLAYVSLVRPHLEYASAAWDPFTARDIKELEMVQRRAARFVKRNYRSTTSVTTLIGELGWNTLEHRRQTSRLTAMYKSVNSLNSVSPDQLHQHSRLTRQVDGNGLSFVQLQCRTDVYKYSFFRRTICNWNKLPLTIRSSPSTDAFKRTLDSLSIAP